MEHFYREIIQSIPKAAQPDSGTVEKLANYGRLLHEENRRYNLTGHKTVEDIIGNLIIESLAPVNLSDVPRGTSFADMGTGAGIPGIPLAITYPDLAFTLFDSNSKKIRFIDYAAEELSIRNIKAVCCRIEEISREKEFRESFDVVVTRAMSDIYTAGELGSPLLKTHGCLYLYVSKKQKEISSTVSAHLEKLSLEILQGGESGSPLNITATSGLLLQKTSPVADIYPRRISAIRRGTSEAENNHK